MFAEAWEVAWQARTLEKQAPGNSEGKPEVTETVQGTLYRGEAERTGVFLWVDLDFVCLTSVAALPWVLCWNLYNR